MTLIYGLFHFVNLRSAARNRRFNEVNPFAFLIKVKKSKPPLLSFYKIISEKGTTVVYPFDLK